MLTKDSLKCAEALASDICEAGMVLSAAGGTPLAELANNTVFAPGTIAALPVTDVEGFAAAVEDVSEQSNNNEHNERLDYLVKQLSEATSLHLSFARNTVLPAVRAVTDDLVGLLGAETQDPLSEFCLIVKELPVPLQNDGFVDSLRTEAQGKLIEPEGTFQFDDRGPLAILELVATGNGAFDDQLKIWAAGLEDSFFLHIWDNLFRSGLEANPAVSESIITMTSNPVTGADAACAILLMVRNLGEKVPDDSRMNAAEYKRLINQYKDVCAHTLLNFLEHEKRMAEQGDLIVTRDLRKKTLVVRGHVYRGWLRESGKPEILFGLLLRGDAASNIAQVNDLRQVGQSSWDNFKNIAGTKYRNEYLARFRDTLNIAFYRDLRKAGEDELEYGKTDNSHISRVHALLEDELALINNSDTKDIPRLVARVVARARFYYTDAFKIMKSIDDACTADPSLSLEEAVRIAGNEYVADYLIDQLRLSN